MLHLKTKLAEKQPYKCVFCQLAGEVTMTTMRQEFKNEQGFEVKMPFCGAHSELSPDVIIEAIKQAFTPPPDPQMNFEDAADDDEGEQASPPEETKALAIRGKRGGRK